MAAQNLRKNQVPHTHTHPKSSHTRSTTGTKRHHQLRNRIGKNGSLWITTPQSTRQRPNQHLRSHRCPKPITSHANSLTNGHFWARHELETSLASRRSQLSHSTLATREIPSHCSGNSRKTSWDDKQIIEISVINETSLSACPRWSWQTLRNSTPTQYAKYR